MKFINYSFFLMAIISTCFSSNAIAGGIINQALNINATFTGSTCNIIVEPIYQFKNLLIGDIVRHPPLEIKWSCEVQLPLLTALKASVVQGNITSSQQEVEMLLERDNQKSGTIFWLETKNGSKVKFSGDDKDHFCPNSAANRQNTCILTPVTQVGTAAKTGPVKSTLQFAVIYL